MTAAESARVPCFRGPSLAASDTQAVEGRESMRATAETAMPTSHRKRVKSFNTPGDAHELTFALGAGLPTPPPLRPQVSFPFLRKKPLGSGQPAVTLLAWNAIDFMAGKGLSFCPSADAEKVARA